MKKSHILRAVGWFGVGLVAGATVFLLQRSPHVTVVHPLGAERPITPHRVELHHYPLLPLTPGAVVPQGKPLLVNLWAPWCGPCLEEWQPLQNLSRRLESHGAATLGLAVATNVATARSFLHQHPSRYPVYLLRAHLRRLATRLGIPVAGVPDTVLLSARGRVLLMVSGKLQAGDVKRFLDALPKKKRRARIN